MVILITVIKFPLDLGKKRTATHPTGENEMEKQVFKIVDGRVVVELVDSEYSPTAIEASLEDIAEWERLWSDYSAERERITNWLIWPPFGSLIISFAVVIFIGYLVSFSSGTHNKLMEWFSTFGNSYPLSSIGIIFATTFGILAAISYALTYRHRHRRRKKARAVLEDGCRAILVHYHKENLPIDAVTTVTTYHYREWGQSITQAWQCAGKHFLLVPFGFQKE